jgi:hypothetical protein
MNGQKLIVINDSIALPELKWGWDFQGPVTNPTYFDDSIIESLLRGTSPVKFMYAVNPEDYSKRFHLTLDTFKMTNEEMFPSVTITPVVETPVKVAEVTEQKVEQVKNEANVEEPNYSDAENVVADTNDDKKIEEVKNVETGDIEPVKQTTVTTNDASGFKPGANAKWAAKNKRA